MSSWHKLFKLFFLNTGKIFDCHVWEWRKCGGGELDIRARVALKWRWINILFLFCSFMLSCVKKQKKNLLTPVTEKSCFQILMSESCSQHKNIAHPTVHIDMKLVLDFVLWHMSQSMRRPNFWTLFNFVHSISVQNKKKHFCFTCFIKSLSVFL